MRPVIVVLSVLAAWGLARPAGAGDRAPVDLPALLEEVERASPQLLATRTRAEAAAQVAPQRNALPDPQLSATYTNDGLTGLTLGGSEFTNFTVGWEQEVPGRAVRRLAAGLADAQAATVSAASVTESAMLRARVITLYARLWRIDRTEALLLESKTLLATAAKTAQARYESGEGIQEGLIRSQLAVRRVDLEIEALSLERRQAEIALGATAGRDGDPRFGLTGGLPEVVGSIDADELALAATATAPDVLETLAKEKAAQAEFADARGQVRPTYSWLAAYQFRGGLDPMVMGGFSVRLPVWKDRKQERAIASAALLRVASQHDRESAVLRARAGARELAAEVASIDARLRLFREAILPQAAAGIESANAAFASGRAEIALVLDDLGRSLDARKEELALSSRRIEAVASLEAMTGTTLFEMSDLSRLQ